MSWNKIGKNVRKATGSVLGEIFEMITSSELPYLKIPRKTVMANSSYSHEQAKKILSEIELKRADQSSLFANSKIVN